MDLYTAAYLVVLKYNVRREIKQEEGANVRGASVKNGRKAPMSVRMPDPTKKKEGLSPPSQCQMGMSARGQRTQRIPNLPSD
eukprot:6197211-Pleurochrysis_carterae.AAC.2